MVDIKICGSHFRLLIEPDSDRGRIPYPRYPNHQTSIKQPLLPPNKHQATTVATKQASSNHCCHLTSIKRNHCCHQTSIKQPLLHQTSIKQPLLPPNKYQATIVATKQASSNHCCHQTSIKQPLLPPNKHQAATVATKQASSNHCCHQTSIKQPPLPPIISSKFLGSPQ
ncbi:hypothetical protein Btru_027488 [Bulinus truncatus]|nr:hypothetical protein Btru_027488 [Bulinus truncatus]